MQTIREVMTPDVRTISPQESVQRAAQMMDELNVGAIPVCDGERLVGMITDRDITVRSVAAGQAPDATRVADVMSTDVRTCTSDQEVDAVMHQMGDVQIRRVPVIDQASQRLVGIVSLGGQAFGPGRPHAGRDLDAGRAGPLDAAALKKVCHGRLAVAAPGYSLSGCCDGCAALNAGSSMHSELMRSMFG
ncbi:CBS domain-containing protein [Massilia sp. YIM B02443]|uniref:CBS domain-containing protein n=1 Tax=Massilia sp. YIM B02443 TaxID=3050127 RepID=UPI0025B69B45|nr:CBS domain-containing protein [Massilia sp. YIM B02443]MDN4036390.1 CBS domain-containing protein [Massilia sp. YIM B02443]